MILRTAGPLLLALVMAAGCADTGPLEISEARVRALIPGQDKTVGYFTVRNSGAEAVVLTGATSPAARAIEMHTTIHEGGVARMRRLPEVVVPAGDAVRFEPGGRHLMLFGVTALGAGTEIVLQTGDGRQIPVRFETIPVGG